MIHVTRNCIWRFKYTVCLPVVSFVSLTVFWSFTIGQSVFCIWPQLEGRGRPGSSIAQRSLKTGSGGRAGAEDSP